MCVRCACACVRVCLRVRVSQRLAMYAYILDSCGTGDSFAAKKKLNG